MPTYNYLCKSCDNKFSEFQNMSDAPIKNCPFCSARVIRLITGGSGMIFKGTGFYITDYGKANKSNQSTLKSDDVKKKKESAKDG